MSKIAALTPRIRNARWKRTAEQYRVDTRMSYRLPWIYPLSICVPSSLSLPLANALTFPRLCLFITLIPTIRELKNKLVRGAYVPVVSDFMVLLMMAWMIMTVVIHQGAKGLIGYGALTAIEFAGGYLLARIYFGTVAGFDQFARVLPVIIGLVMLTALLDTASGQYLMQRLGWQISGSPPPEDFPKRFGLIRAQGSLEHPILLGIFFVISVNLLYHSLLPPLKKFIWIALCLFGLLLPLSSAPLLSMTMTFGLILVIHHLRGLPWGVLTIMLSGAFFVACFMVMVDNPVITLINHLTLDPQTGIFRTLIWKWALVNIERAPWIGIGFDDWLRSEEMPPSIDSLYLVQSIRYGIPALAFLMLGIFTTGFSMQSKPLVLFPDPRIAFIRSGLGICLFIICFNAFTVQFWGADWVILAMIMGMRAGLTESQYMPPAMRGDDAPSPASPPKRTNPVARPVSLSERNQS